MTPQEEQYVHLEECIWSFNEAWRILNEVRAATTKTAIHAAAYRYALVAYARPYTRSDGEHKKGRNPYLLSPLPLTAEDDALHHQILNLRRQVLAHSDLTVKQAAVYPARFGGQASICVASNSIPTFPEIDAVIALIERTLDILYVQWTKDADELAPKA